MSTSSNEPQGLERGVSLAPLTTLDLGGPAELFHRAGSEVDLLDVLEWARRQDLEVHILGGGSNVVISDRGLLGLAVRLELSGIEVVESDGEMLVTAAAGEPWDRLVERAVGEGWAGIECLSGIPGLVGATPIQNVGAYGQEVSDTIARVRVLDRSTGERVDLEPEQCDFGYRSSRFKKEPGRFIVLSTTFRLRSDGKPTLRYPELVRAVGTDSPSLAEVRETVLSLRRSKSMVIDPPTGLGAGATDLELDDPNRRSVGSFFVNPVVSDDEADRVIERALDSGVVCRPEDVPRFAVGLDRSKLAAGWLIERAGFFKGQLHGNVGISSRHALALVHHGGGTSAELIELAREVQAGVDRAFGVRLRPEPVFLGFERHPLL